MVADILPPPVYLVDTYLVIHKMAEPSNRAFLAGLEQKGLDLRKEYEARHEFWMANLPETNESERHLKTALVTDSYEPAIRFLNIARDEFLPAVQRSDYAAAEALLHGALQENYEQHRTAIDQVVLMASARNRIIEEDAGKVITARVAVLTILGAVIVLGMLLGIPLFVNGCIAEALKTAASQPSPEGGAPGTGQNHTPTIGALTALVGDLARQMHVLVLHAAGEVARGTEQDRGFREMAGEMRGLAEENRNLSWHIHALVERFEPAAVPAQEENA